MNEDEKKLRKRLLADLEFYCKKNLKIRTKTENEDGQKIVPLVLNKAQRFIHKRLEDQKAETGKVRALILKGRQQGSSTYVAARFYHHTTHHAGRKTFILTHLDDATNNLFNLVKRYHDNCNIILKPSTSATNRKELVFDMLDSAYAVGTAGSGQTGRSDTIDLLHASEAAFYTKPKEIRAGVFQAANEAQEVIVESTANGFDGMFKPMWDSALRGDSDYIPVFVPWFWQDEYAREVPGDFELSKDEAELLSLYESDGLTLENVVWRRFKINSDLGGDDVLFKQEYPCNSNEAFQQTGVDSFIPADLVVKARKRKEARQFGAHIVGVDPARGGDRTAFVHRQGSVMWYKDDEIIKTPNTKVIKRKIIELFEGIKPADYVFIDVGGLGGPIYDDFIGTKYEEYIKPVNFGSTDCMNPERYVNRKAEMIGEFKEWLQDDTFPAQITDSDEFQSDICAPSWDYDSKQRIFIEGKKSLKSRGIPSTDLLDAGGLTFAEPVAPRCDNNDYDDGGLDML